MMHDSANILYCSPDFDDSVEKETSYTRLMRSNITKTSLIASDVINETHVL